MAVSKASSIPYTPRTTTADGFRRDELRPGERLQNIITGNIGVIAADSERPEAVAPSSEERVPISRRKCSGKHVGSTTHPYWHLANVRCIDREPRVQILTREDLKPGDKVRHKHFGITAEVIADPLQPGQLTVAHSDYVRVTYVNDSGNLRIVTWLVNNVERLPLRGAAK